LKTGRNIQFIIPKKETGPYWPRLVKEKAKPHWLRVDFSKYKDEDEDAEADVESNPLAGMDFSSMMGGAGGMGGMPDFGSMPEDEEADSDDEEMPALEEASNPQ
jgi:prostaglandin-E synthase